MGETAGITQIAQTIQLAIGPVFLLVATGSMLNFITGRLARVVDRARDLQRLHGETSGSEHERVVKELRRLDRRMDIINWSIGLCVACGIVVCLLVTMLFVAGSGFAQFSTLIAGTFSLAMVLLTAGLIAFLIEVRMAIKTIHVPVELLEREAAEQRQSQQR